MTNPPEHSALAHLSRDLRAPCCRSWPGRCGRRSPFGIAAGGSPSPRRGAPRTSAWPRPAPIGARARALGELDRLRRGGARLRPLVEFAGARSWAPRLTAGARARRDDRPALGQAYDEINLLYRFGRVLRPDESFAASAERLLSETAELLDRAAAHLQRARRGRIHLALPSWMRSADAPCAGSRTPPGTSRRSTRVRPAERAAARGSRAARRARSFTPHGLDRLHRGRPCAPVPRLPASSVPSAPRTRPTVRDRRAAAARVPGAGGLQRGHDTPAPRTRGECSSTPCAGSSPRSTPRTSTPAATRSASSTSRVWIGETAGSRDEQIRLLSWAALLHDVGKIAIHGDILNKPGRLTDEEYAAIKTHPARGLPGPGADPAAARRSCRRIRHHHERWDGRGYPDGLRAEEIPLLARIIAVADTYDAIVSTRAYRGRARRASRCEEIAAGPGSQFDPAIVPSLPRSGAGRRAGGADAGSRGRGRRGRGRGGGARGVSPRGMERAHAGQNESHGGRDLPGSRRGDGGRRPRGARERRGGCPHARRGRPGRRSASRALHR